MCLEHCFSFLHIVICGIEARTNFFTVWYVFYDVIQIVLLLNILRFAQQCKVGRLVHVTPEKGGCIPFKCL